MIAGSLVELCFEWSSIVTNEYFLWSDMKTRIRGTKTVMFTNTRLVPCPPPKKKDLHDFRKPHFQVNFNWTRCKVQHHWAKCGKIGQALSLIYISSETSLKQTAPSSVENETCSLVGTAASVQLQVWTQRITFLQFKTGIITRWNWISD